MAAIFYHWQFVRKGFNARKNRSLNSICIVESNGRTKNKQIERKLNDVDKLQSSITLREFEYTKNPDKPMNKDNDPASVMSFQVSFL